MTSIAQTAGTSATNQGVGLGGLFKAALLGGAVAAVANVALLLGAQAAGVPMTGEFQPGTVSGLLLPAVVLSSIVPGLVGALVAFGFKKRFAANAARNFAILSVVFTVLSFGGPANVPQLATSSLVVMELMHVIAALGLGGMLVRALRS